MSRASTTLSSWWSLARALNAYAGSYRCDELDATIRVRTEDGKLHAVYANPFKDSSEDPLEPTLADRFEQSSVTLEFTRDSKGKPVSFRLGADRVRNLLCERSGDGP